MCTEQYRLENFGLSHMGNSQISVIITPCVRLKLHTLRLTNLQCLPVIFLHLLDIYRIMCPCSHWAFSYFHICCNNVYGIFHVSSELQPCLSWKMFNFSLWFLPFFRLHFDVSSSPDISEFVSPYLFWIPTITFVGTHYLQLPPAFLCAIHAESLPNNSPHFLHLCKFLIFVNLE